MDKDFEIKLRETGDYAENAALQDFAEEMAIRYMVAEADKRGLQAQNEVLKQELMKKEDDILALRKALDDSEERAMAWHRETEAAAAGLDALIEKIRKIKEDNTELSIKNTELETQIRRMVAEEADRKRKVASACVAYSPVERETELRSGQLDTQERTDTLYVRENESE